MSKHKDFPSYSYKQIEDFANDYSNSGVANMSKSDRDFLFLGLRVVKEGLTIMQKAADHAYYKAHKELDAKIKPRLIKGTKEQVRDAIVDNVKETSSIDIEKDVRR